MRCFVSAGAIEGGRAKEGSRWEDIYRHILLCLPNPTHQTSHHVDEKSTTKRLDRDEKKDWTPEVGRFISIIHPSLR